jgi:hypothetical protein
MNVDQILDVAIRSIKSALPEAIYQGSLVKQTRAFDASTSKARLIESEITPVEVIFDSFKYQEIIGSNILATDVKLMIIANAVFDIDFYTVVRVKGNDYTIKNKLDTVVGSTAALFTIVAQL